MVRIRWPSRPRLLPRLLLRLLLRLLFERIVVDSAVEDALLCVAEDDDREKEPPPNCEMRFAAERLRIR